MLTTTAAGLLLLDCPALSMCTLTATATQRPNSCRVQPERFRPTIQPNKACNRIKLATHLPVEVAFVICMEWHCVVVRVGQVGVRLLLKLLLQLLELRPRRQAGRQAGMRMQEDSRKAPTRRQQQQQQGSGQQAGGRAAGLWVGDTAPSGCVGVGMCFARFASRYALLAVQPCTPAGRAYEWRAAAPSALM